MFESDRVRELTDDDDDAIGLMIFRTCEKSLNADVHLPHLTFQMELNPLYTFSLDEYEASLFLFSRPRRHEQSNFYSTPAF